MEMSQHDQIELGLIYLKRNHEDYSERTKTMVPNIHIHEQLMFEQVRELQRQSDQQRLLAHLAPDPGPGRSRG